MQVIIYEGENIEFVEHEGVYYLAAKPMCKILGLDYPSQAERLRNHKTFKKHTLLIKHIAADSKMRKMICISEAFVYGWIYSIRSKKPNFVNFQEGLYISLHNHFKPKSQILTVKPKKP